jgi:hypothetical protein
MKEQNVKRLNKRTSASAKKCPNLYAMSNRSSLLDYANNVRLRLGSTSSSKMKKVVYSNKELTVLKK